MAKTMVTYPWQINQRLGIREECKCSFCGRRAWNGWSGPGICKERILGKDCVPLKPRKKRGRKKLLPFEEGGWKSFAEIEAEESSLKKPKTWWQNLLERLNFL